MCGSHDEACNGQCGYVPEMIVDDAVDADAISGVTIDSVDHMLATDALARMIPSALRSNAVVLFERLRMHIGTYQHGKFTIPVRARIACI